MRFVVLHHFVTDEFVQKSGRGTHFDLMLEFGDSLRTWAIEHWPLPQQIPQRANRLQDHRLAYLEYQGPLSGARGHVVREAMGTYEILEKTDDWLVVRLNEMSNASRLKIEFETITAWSDESF